MCMCVCLSDFVKPLLRRGNLNEKIAVGSIEEMGVVRALLCVHVCVCACWLVPCFLAFFFLVKREGRKEVGQAACSSSSSGIGFIYVTSG